MAILSPNTDATAQSIMTAAGAIEVVETTDDLLTNTEGRDENGRTSDEIFDELEDDNHVATSGRGSRLEHTVSTGGSTATGYSAGSGSGSGSD